MSRLCLRSLGAGILKGSRRALAVHVIRPVAKHVALESKWSPPAQLQIARYSSFKDSTNAKDPNAKLMAECEAMMSVGSLYQVVSLDAENKIVKIALRGPDKKFKVAFRMDNFVECNEDWSARRSTFESIFDCCEEQNDKSRDKFLLSTKKPCFIVEVDLGGSNFYLKCELLSHQEAILAGRKFCFAGYGFGIAVGGTEATKFIICFDLLGKSQDHSILSSPCELSSSAFQNILPLGDVSCQDDESQREELYRLLSSKGVNDFLVEDMRLWCKNFDPSKLETAYNRGCLKGLVKEESK